VVSPLATGAFVVSVIATSGTNRSVWLADVLAFVCLLVGVLARP